jgi:hypothetical protein
MRLRKPGREAGATLRADARGRDGGIREELAAGMTKRPDPLCHRRAGACQRL